MTLRYLEVFLALAQTPNMRDVAARLYVSQAAVSSALRDFESELGVELFDRVGRGIRLNETGRLLESRLAPMHNQLRNVLSLINTETLMGKLYVGASITLADSVLPQILYEMKMRHAHLEISCQSGNTARIARLVENGRLDIGFVEGEVDSLDVQLTPIAHEKLVLVTADAAVAQSPHNIAELMDAFWLLREAGSGTREALLRHLAPLGLSPLRHLELSHTDAIKQVLRNPGTVSCMSPRAVTHEVSTGQLFVIPITDVNFERVFYRVEHREAMPSRLRNALAAEVEARLAPDSLGDEIFGE